MKLHNALILASLVAILPACAGEEAPEGPLGPVEMSFGTGIDDSYSALEHGSSCKVRFATQGGFWAMYRVRATNIPDGAELDCGLLVGDELVGERPTIMRHVEGTDTSYGSLQLPVLPTEQNRVGTLAGRQGEMYCFYNEKLYSTDVVIDVTYPDDGAYLRTVSNPRENSF